MYVYVTEVNFSIISYSYPGNYGKRNLASLKSFGRVQIAIRDNDPTLVPRAGLFDNMTNWYT